MREEDRHGNAMTYTYNGSQQLTQIEDPDSRDIDLTWTSGKLTADQDWAVVTRAGSSRSRARPTGPTGSSTQARTCAGWADPLAPTGDCTAGRQPHHLPDQLVRPASTSTKTQTYALLDTAPNPDVIGERRPGR